MKYEKSYNQMKKMNKVYLFLICIISFMYPNISNGVTRPIRISDIGPCLSVGNCPDGIVVCNGQFTYPDISLPGSQQMFSANIKIDPDTSAGGVELSCAAGALAEPFYINGVVVSTTQTETTEYGSKTFTAPTAMGVYPIEIGIGVGMSGHSGIRKTYDVSMRVGEVCSDGIDNDSAQGADSLDPQCHTDCNANNPGSYSPTHNSETIPPNGVGSCPAPASLQLNGRAAFFQVVKNFFASITARAFAGE